MCDDLREFEVKIREFTGQLGRYRENISRQSFLGNELALARILEFLPASAPSPAAKVVPPVNSIP